jgi:hypothetical protein
VRKLKPATGQDFSVPPPLIRPHQLSYFRNINGASNYGPNHFFPPPPPPPPPRPSLPRNMPHHPFHQQDLFDSFMSYGPLPMPITNQLAPNQLCNAREGSTRVKNQVALALWGQSLFASNTLFELIGWAPAQFQAVPQVQHF